MWTSFVFIAALTIVSQGVDARLFYSFTRNVLRNINTRINAGNAFGNGIPVRLPVPASVQFSYNTDYKSVGDFCYTNGIPGLCTVMSKCPEVMRNIQKGINPVVCSFQATNVIVCCPARQSQSNNQPMWSSGNNNYNLNNQFFQQGNTKQNPQNNQMNLAYPKQPTTQQGNQASQQNLSGHRLRRSEQKCEDYTKLASHSRSFTSLSIMATTRAVNIPTCTYPTALIIGGEKARAGEFPHMAAIGWTRNGKVDYRCGGSLISESFVLTAGHCGSFYGIPPDTIRLGDQNLVRNDDNAQPQNYQVAEVIVHPDYRLSSSYYDIALIRLAPQVAFTRYIRPACLWQTNYINSTKTIATGWGQLEYAGERSDDLRKVALNVIDNHRCQQLYETSKKLRNGIVNSQLCAGYLDGGKDTCQGDSGGPIQVITPRNQCIFHIIGITSFGKACAAVNTAGVYTRVSSYLDWIEPIVWP